EGSETDARAIFEMRLSKGHQVALRSAGRAHCVAIHSPILIKAFKICSQERCRSVVSTDEESSECHLGNAKDEEAANRAASHVRPGECSAPRKETRHPTYPCSRPLRQEKDEDGCSDDAGPHVNEHEDPVRRRPAHVQDLMPVWVTTMCQD